MFAVHEPFTQPMRNRLKTTAMGLGLVRLLQDARRFEESRTTLYSLEFGIQSDAVESNEPKPKMNQGNELNHCVPAGCSF